MGSNVTGCFEPSFLGSSATKPNKSITGSLEPSFLGNKSITGSLEPSFLGSSATKPNKSITGSLEPSFLGNKSITGSLEPSFLGSSASKPNKSITGSLEPSFLGSSASKPNKSITGSFEPSFLNFSQSKKISPNKSNSVDIPSLPELSFMSAILTNRKLSPNREKGIIPTYEPSFMGSSKIVLPSPSTTSTSTPTLITPRQIMTRSKTLGISASKSSTSTSTSLEQKGPTTTIVATNSLSTSTRVNRLSSTTIKTATVTNKKNNNNKQSESSTNTSKNFSSKNIFVPTPEPSFITSDNNNNNSLLLPSGQLFTDQSLMGLDFSINRSSGGMLNMDDRMTFTGLLEGNENESGKNDNSVKPVESSEVTCTEQHHQQEKQHQQQQQQHQKQQQQQENQPEMQQQPPTIKISNNKEIEEKEKNQKKIQTKFTFDIIPEAESNKDTVSAILKNYNKSVASSSSSSSSSLRPSSSSMFSLGDESDKTDKRTALNMIKSVSDIDASPVIPFQTNIVTKGKEVFLANDNDITTPSKEPLQFTSTIPESRNQVQSSTSPSTNATFNSSTLVTPPIGVILSTPAQVQPSSNTNTISKFSTLVTPPVGTFDSNGKSRQKFSGKSNLDKKLAASKSLDEKRMMINKDDSQSLVISPTSFSSALSTASITPTLTITGAKTSSSTTTTTNVNSGNSNNGNSALPMSRARRALASLGNPTPSPSLSVLTKSTSLTSSSSTGSATNALNIADTPTSRPLTFPNINTPKPIDNFQKEVPINDRSIPETPSPFKLANTPLVTPVADSNAYNSLKSMLSSVSDALVTENSINLENGEVSTQTTVGNSVTFSNIGPTSVATNTSSTTVSSSISTSTSTSKPQFKVIPFETAETITTPTGSSVAKSSVRSPSNVATTEQKTTPTITKLINRPIEHAHMSDTTLIVAPSRKRPRVEIEDDSNDIIEDTVNNKIDMNDDTIVAENRIEPATPAINKSSFSTNEIEPVEQIIQPDISESITEESENGIEQSVISQFQFRTKNTTNEEDIVTENEIVEPIDVNESSISEIDDSVKQTIQPEKTDTIAENEGDTVENERVEFINKLSSISEVNDHIEQSEKAVTTTDIVENERVEPINIISGANESIIQPEKALEEPSSLKNTETEKEKNSELESNNKAISEINESEIIQHEEPPFKEDDNQHRNGYDYKENEDDDDDDEDDDDDDEVNLSSILSSSVHHTQSSSKFNINSSGNNASYVIYDGGDEHELDRNNSNNNNNDSNMSTNTSASSVTREDNNEDDELIGDIISSNDQLQSLAEG
eukprot:TRINITY_DN1343_c0_g1_i1.p1 TRINITY_DN1343_c0_g1~~TRINITY_DN1343_c0_g1_i1.p1  ORF type:complete len:1355 (-),score=454.41 TRINITY_DN1343_c0_g1_i1:259-4143(-)